MTKITYREIPEYTENGKKQIKIPNSKKGSLQNGAISEVWIGNEGFEVFEIPNYSKEDVTYNVEDFIETTPVVEKAEEEKVAEQKYTGTTYEEARKIARQNGNTIIDELKYDRIKIEPDKLSQESIEKWEKYFLIQKPKTLDAKLYIAKQLRELIPEKYKIEYDELMSIKQSEKQIAPVTEKKQKPTVEKNNSNCMISLYTVARKSDGKILLNNATTDELSKLLTEQKMTIKDYEFISRTMSLEKYLELKSTENHVDITKEEVQKEEMTKSEETQPEISENQKSTVTNIEKLNVPELSEKIYQKETLEKIQKINDSQVDSKKLFVGAKITKEEKGKLIEEYCKAIKLTPSNIKDPKYTIIEVLKSVEEFAKDNDINIDDYDISYLGTPEPIILKEAENNTIEPETPKEENTAGYETWIDVTNNPSIIGIETKEEYYKRCFPESKQR